MARLNEASHEEAIAALLACCGSARWAERVAAHRPYPDTSALLAAGDEAAYDLRPADLTEALADEYPAGPHPDVPQRPHVLMALAAAHDAYEARFGHPFVICLDGYRPEERLDQILADIRLRLTQEPEDEREVAAEQLRGVARGRLRQLAAGWGEPFPPVVPGSPSVAV
ncbi:2-oxo-4-hydroxy-4-carboxy-5-ureidoimidazoline decarboxylase [Streptomyces sp. NPDC058953]|uniref:2-oxo-4-hydroxy-4-carboxy-5-ureidoimidazoline decarboxylase n=1 Tax=unclassified Streptomyces TaxID=2593676 RepID=UPI0036A97B8A